MNKKNINFPTKQLKICKQIKTMLNICAHKLIVERRIAKGKLKK